SRISLNFSADESTVITTLAATLLVPNTNYDTAATDDARKKARESVLVCLRRELCVPQRRGIKSRAERVFAAPACCDS
ncbi:MAG: hypothetical protein ACMG6H_12575, partial [Acidobacteriota bacterium]